MVSYQFMDKYRNYSKTLNNKFSQVVLNPHRTGRICEIHRLRKYRFESCPDFIKY